MPLIESQILDSGQTTASANTDAVMARATIACDPIPVVIEAFNVESVLDLGAGRIKVTYTNPALGVS